MISLVKKIIPTVVPSRSNSSNAEIIIKFLQGKYDLFENKIKEFKKTVKTEIVSIMIKNLIELIKVKNKERIISVTFFSLISLT
jgi:hypothetical protein